MRSLFQPIHDTADSISNSFFAKIDEQPEADVRQSQISRNLFLENPWHLLDGFQFHEQFVLHDNVRFKTFLQSDIFPNDRTGIFDLICKPRFCSSYTITAWYTDSRSPGPSRR